MKLRDSFASNERFEGDRVLRWRTIPANAKIVSARATLTPIDGGLGIPFAEVLNFNGRGEFGATKIAVTTGAVTTHWLEVDFHARRTLVSVAGRFSNAALQVDVGGGTYVEINQAGAFRTPADTAATARFPIDGSTVSLPGLRVAKLKITNSGVTPASTSDPVVNSIIISSLPTNVSLRLEPLSPFFTHPGELTQAETSADFATVLQAALVDGRIENGFYDLRLTLHSDTIARLQVDLEIDFLAEKNPLPEGLDEVVLPFDFSTLAQSSAATLNIAVPPNSRAVPEQTTARVRGNFAESRIAPIAYGSPTGAAKPVAAVEVSPASSQAQLIAVDDKDVPLTAIDLLLESKTPSAQLRVDIRNDLDGKPGDDSLLTTPVELSVSSQTGKGARWESVPLAAERLLSKSRRYWLVVQSIQGTVAWSVAKPPSATKSGTSSTAITQPIDKATSRLFNVQTTRDGGLSWRDAIATPGTLVEPATSAAGPFVAFFRLRTQPKTFKVPIELLAGSDAREVRIKLDRFEPLGRVDFALDTELAQGINESLDKTPATASTDAEHLLNGDFERWAALGSDVEPPSRIPIGALMEAVAFSPDGKWGYLLDVTHIKVGTIIIVDTDCGKKLDEHITLKLNDPTAFVVSADGRRAYVLGFPPVGEDVLVQIVDLENRAAVGTPFAITKTLTETLTHALAASPDGKFLYLVTLNSHTLRIHVIDTVKLEQQAVTGVTVPDVEVILPISAPEETAAPRALALSPDGQFLYIVVERASADPAKVRIFDTRTGVFLTTPDITVGHTSISNRTALALTQDGTRALVTNAPDNSISVVDLVSGNVTSISVGAPPGDVAISQDGTRAYALSRTGRSVSVIDLNGNVVVGAPILISGTDPSPVALGLTPQGDRLYVAVNEDGPSASFVSSIQIGKRLPAEWHLTSGEATPFCIDAPFHLVSILGSQLTQTGLSQVMSVAPSTVYEFSFWGIARESDTDVTPALAEVLWLGDDCGAVGSPLSIPIQLMTAPSTAAAGAPREELIFDPNGAGRTSPLQLHRARATSPAGAKQAEVRFTIPMEGLAAIDQVSLITTSEEALNGDFKQQDAGRLTGWKVSPTNAPGFRVLATADGIQLLNASATTVELIQAVDAKSGEPFTLGVEGRTTVAAATNPRIDVRWIKSDGAATGSPTVIEIDSGSSSFLVASGSAPDDAAHAEIHLTIPAGSTLEVKRTSLRFSALTIVPISFIAEAPGELTVSDVRVAFEEVEATGPPRDVQLCIATPPGHDPGKEHCPCDVCAAEDSGEPEAADSMAQPVVVVPHLSSPGALNLMTIPPAFRLTDVPGIAEARARQLIAIGIDSVAKLASSTPDTVAQIKFITPKMAARIIADAKSLIP